MLWIGHTPCNTITPCAYLVSPAHTSPSPEPPFPAPPPPPAGAAFFIINGPEIMSKLAGESESNLRKVGLLQAC
jgi:SpoVK/Ycf46/Vps4 family AAA+-type ATPase